MSKNEGSKMADRKFTHLSRAWYGVGIIQRDRELIDEVTFGIYSEDGSTSGEMQMRWEELGGRPVPRLLAFSDSWRVLASMPDVVQLLGELDSTDPTPAQFCALLERHGFEDRTPRVQS